MPKNPDTLPTLNDLSGDCPRCGRSAAFEVIHSDALRQVVSHWNALAGSGGMLPDVKDIPRRTVERFGIIGCMACGGRSVVIEAEVNGIQRLEGVLWWPTEHLVNMSPNAGVPQNVVDAYSEGLRCLSVNAPNAAAAMFRTAIAHIVMDKGSDAARKARNLNAKINQMADDRTLWSDFSEDAHHVRAWGNAGAHGEEYTAITVDEATDLQEFIKQVINFVYIQPHKRRQALAPTRRTTPAAEPEQATGDQE